METGRIALRQRERDRLRVLPRFKFEKTWLFIALLGSRVVCKPSSQTLNSTTYPIKATVRLRNSHFPTRDGRYSERENGYESRGAWLSV